MAVLQLMAYALVAFFVAHGISDIANSLDDWPRTVFLSVLMVCITVAGIATLHILYRGEK